MKINDALKIMKQFRDREGNSKEDIEAFNLVIAAIEPHTNNSKDMYLYGYIEGFEDAKQLYS